MPAVTGKQYRLMAMVAHDPAMAKKMGMKQSMAEEFVHATSAKKRSLWSKGGHTIMSGKR